MQLSLVLLSNPSLILLVDPASRHVDAALPSLGAFAQYTLHNVVMCSSHHGGLPADQDARD